jgi:hypothetical protein
MMTNIRLLHPEYEYVFFDDERVVTFISDEFPEFRSVFDAFAFPIQRFDFFRYLAIYHHGGFYFDLDVLLAANLSPLLDAGCVFPFEGLTMSHHLRRRHHIDWELGNYAFGAAPKHPFLAAVIENCVRAQKNPAWVKPMMRGAPPFFNAEFFVLNSTGPGLLTRTFAEHPELATSVTVLFPEDVCDVASWHSFGNHGVHMMDGTWRSKSGFFRRRFAQYWELWNTRRLLNESRKLGPKRSVQPGKTS